MFIERWCTSFSCSNVRCFVFCSVLMTTNGTSLSFGLTSDSDQLFRNQTLYVFLPSLRVLLSVWAQCESLYCILPSFPLLPECFAAGVDTNMKWNRDRDDIRVDDRMCCGCVFRENLYCLIQLLTADSFCFHRRPWYQYTMHKWSIRNVAIGAFFILKAERLSGHPLVLK